MTEAAPPRLAATVLLVRDDPFEVLMIRRSSRTHFASALVFPGGVVDPDDHDTAWLPLLDGAESLDSTERALRIAACRETFEEVGLLLAPVETCQSPHADGFRATIASGGIRLPLDALAPFAHWITPAGRPKRFDTHFFLAAAPRGQEPCCDGGETVALEWIAPAAAIARAEAGDESLMLPTLLNLRRLAESGTVADALRRARLRPPFTVEPRITLREGGFVALIPAEAGYGGTEFAHRGRD